MGITVRKDCLAHQPADSRIAQQKFANIYTKTMSTEARPWFKFLLGIHKLCTLFSTLSPWFSSLWKENNSYLEGWLQRLNEVCEDSKSEALNEL